MDKTGLNAHYDFKLVWTPDESQPGLPRNFRPATGDPPAPDPLGPSIFTALQEQLGLKLESQKASVEMLVIEHAEKPSAN